MRTRFSPATGAGAGCAGGGGGGAVRRDLLLAGMAGVKYIERWFFGGEGSSGEEISVSEPEFELADEEDGEDGGNLDDVGLVLVLDVGGDGCDIDDRSDGEV